MFSIPIRTTYFLLSSSKREFITTKRKTKQSKNYSNKKIICQFAPNQLCLCDWKQDCVVWLKCFFFLLLNLHEVDHLTICICVRIEKKQLMRITHDTTRLNQNCYGRNSYIFIYAAGVSSFYTFHCNDGFFLSNYASLL